MNQKDISKMHIVYDTTEKYIRIFGEEFVNNNKNKILIIKLVFNV